MNGNMKTIMFIEVIHDLGFSNQYYNEYQIIRHYSDNSCEALLVNVPTDQSLFIG